MALSPGTYPATAVSHEFGVSPMKGTKYVKVKFKLDNGDEAEWTGWLTKAAASVTTDALLACGCTFEDGKISNLTGLGSQKVNLVVQPRRDDPSVNEIRFINPITDGTVDFDSLDDQMRAYVMEAKTKAPF